MGIAKSTVPLAGVNALQKYRARFADKGLVEDKKQNSAQTNTESIK